MKKQILCPALYQLHVLSVATKPPVFKAAELPVEKHCHTE
jgi:hypothetical protein